MRLHNTLSGQIEEFVPREKGKATVYVCGITPYDYCHLGHARTLVCFDILRRWMIHRGLDVNFIQNVTDIDDKILRRASENKEKGRSLSEPLALSAHFDALSRKDMESLGIQTPTNMPKISEHIPQTIALIEKIIASQHAYVTSSGVYFDISSFPSYGKLSRQNLDKVRAGARIEVDEQKGNPEDFALWKLDGAPGCAHEPARGAPKVCRLCATSDSPWGRGRPGWHIECSAMSLHYGGGKPLDLHGGARDLIFPHHENEIAQSEAAGIMPFSRMWAHTGFLTVKGEKMAKSLGNFITICDALRTWDGPTLRLFFALAHYRSPIDFSESALNSAKTTLDNARRSLTLMEGEGAKKKSAASEKADSQLAASLQAKLSSFSSFMDEDLDTPQALASLFEAAREAARARSEGVCSRQSLQWACGEVSGAFSILGLPVQVKTMQAARMPKDQIESLLAEREAARKKKDFARSDAIRKQLADAGVILEDSKTGAKWRYS